MLFEILVVDHTLIKINIFANFTLFSINIAATGKAPYKGPAAVENLTLIEEENNYPIKIKIMDK